MKLAVYRDLDEKIVRTHIVNLDNEAISTAVKQHNAAAAGRTVEVIEAEDNGLIAYLWTAYRTRLAGLQDELREAEDAADDLSRRLSSLRGEVFE